MSLRVAVSGGSIGGVTAALVLRDAGCDVDVYERSATRLDGLGAGIVLHEASLRYLVERRGLPLDEVSTGARVLRYLDPGGTTVYEEPSSLRFTSWNALHRGLLAGFPADRYRLGAGVVGFEARDGGDGVDVLVEGQSRRTYDLLVCAEGISSTTRRQLLPDVEPRYAGYVGWRGTLSADVLDRTTWADLEDAITYAVPPHNQALLYPIPGPLLNWVWYRNVAAGESLRSLLTDRRGVERPLSLGPGTVRADVVAELRDAAGAVLPPQLAEAVVRTESPFVQVIVDLGVPRMAFGRVCLLGDAAFAARPHAAAGTAKAAEDGWALADALLAADGDVDAALARWEPQQLELGRLVVGRSSAMGQRSQVDCTWYPEDRSLRFGLRAAGR